MDRPKNLNKFVGFSQNGLLRLPDIDELIGLDIVVFDEEAEVDLRLGWQVHHRLKKSSDEALQFRSEVDRCFFLKDSASSLDVSLHDPILPTDWMRSYASVPDAVEVANKICDVLLSKFSDANKQGEALAGLEASFAKN